MLNQTLKARSPDRASNMGTFAGDALHLAHGPLGDRALPDEVDCDAYRQNTLESG